MKLLAVNGSPNPKGITQALLKQIVKAAAQEDSIINLRDYTILPCLGCRSCVKTNVCIRNDDWSKVVASLAEADLLVIGFPTYYGAALGLNALTHNFLERWFSLRHRGFKLKARKAIAVVVSGEGHAEFGLQSIKTFLEVYHGMELADSVTAEGVTPCYLCGQGETCVLSCVRARHGEDVVITADLIPSLERQPEVVDKAIEIGRKIKTGQI
ncbi:flavodoxin family protein [Calderihabitans maritimus]|uniref:NADPH-dependent FMN reductase n=1 Tax=Calderihabitans maritimus TaxID=1246530 RepID=A0A1Z5HN63_9FIRM|nr:flavodoxin family protein [Calderihabitans maritimus]GAW90959.1 NADPH-dependent FMN reductase [Calderihabitans maritimus]